ncbi:DsrE family protein [Desulfosarcina sp.]|uniref:DsrE family protein n=1 Tax=Desulfosarcina sp. TaxID=2027861 RepID=UPI003970B6DC
MKIAILLKSGPCTDEASRALKTADDMLALGHSVNLYLLQEAVRFCRPRATCPDSGKLKELTEKNLRVYVLTRDAELRGIDGSSAGPAISDGSYEALVDLMTTCDRVVGIL